MTGPLSLLRLAGAARRHDPAVVGWSWRALRRTRRELRRTTLDEVVLPRPPSRPGSGAFTVERVLAWRRASCLERCVVMQRWYASLGQAVEVTVGVTSPATGFRSHAWLSIDPEAAQPSMTVLHRHRPPAHWLTSP